MKGSGSEEQKVYKVELALSSQKARNWSKATGVTSRKPGADSKQFPLAREGTF